MEIKNIEGLIKPLLKDGKKFLSYECKNLLSSGENYGSVMLRVDIKLQNRKGEKEMLYCVAKTCPSSEMLWRIFNTEITFKNEIALYETIVPTLNEFGKSKGVDNLIDFTAEYIGSRISLDPDSDKVDFDAALLLENLKMRGYDNEDRLEGFDMACAKALLRNLATWHAAPIAFKLAKPAEFKSKIRPYLKRALHLDEYDFIDNKIKAAEEAVLSNEESAPYVSKIGEHLSKTKHPVYLEPIEPYATITHNDFWVNNAMLKMVDGKPAKTAMVDFQNIGYGSPTGDVIFFLYTSVSTAILRNNVDHLLKYYHDVFVDALRRLGCDSQQFTFEHFMEELRSVSKANEISHILFMLNVIFKKKGEAKESTDFDVNDVIHRNDSLHENYYERLHFVLLDFVKRGWA